MKKIVLMAFVLICIVSFSSCKIKSCKKQENPPVVEEKTNLILELSKDYTYYIVRGINVESTIITIPATFKGIKIKEIGENAFEENQFLQSVVIEEGVEVISGNAFLKCVNLMSIILPSTLKLIRNNAFLGCDKLVEIFNLSNLDIQKGSKLNGLIALNAIKINKEISDSKLLYDSGFIYLFDNEIIYLLSYQGEEKEVRIKEFGKSVILFNSMFYNNQNIEKVILSDEVIEVNDKVFYNCYNLKHIDLKNISDLGSYTFGNCYKLKDLVIPSSLKNKGINVFENCYRLVEVFNLSNLNILQNEELDNVYDVYHDLNANTKIKFVNDFEIYQSADKTVLISYLGSSNNVELPNLGVEYSIGKGAFINNNKIVLLNFNDVITNIQESAFENCINLQNILNVSNIKSIESDAFYGCFNLLSINLPSTLEYIGDNAFSYCYRLVEIFNESFFELSQGDSKYGNVALYAKVIHNSFIVESSLINFEDFLFLINEEKCYLVSYLGKSKRIDLPAYLYGSHYEINTGAFYGLNTIEEVYIYDDVVKISEFAFMNCENLRFVSIGNKVNYIGEYAFYNCPSLTSIIFTTPKNWKVSSGTFDKFLIEDQISPEATAVFFKNNAYFNFSQILN